MDFVYNSYCCTVVDPFWFAVGPWVPGVVVVWRGRRFEIAIFGDLRGFGGHLLQMCVYMMSACAGVRFDALSRFRFVLQGVAQVFGRTGEARAQCIANILVSKRFSGAHTWLSLAAYKRHTECMSSGGGSFGCLYIELLPQSDGKHISLPVP